MIIKIISDLEPTHLKNENISLKIYGDLVGYIKDEIYFNTQETLKILSSLNEPNEIEEILYGTIGSFFLLIETLEDSRCYSSLVHNGIYYYLDLNSSTFYISEDESDLVHRDDLVRDNVIRRIGKVNPGLHRFPLSSLFEKIERCPAGAYVQISKTSIVKNYLNKIFLNNSISKGNKLSSDLLEKRLGLILNAYRDFYGKFSLFMSGGIDSSVLMAVLKKNNIDTKSYYIPYSGLGSNNHKIAEYISLELGEKLNIVEEDNSSLNQTTEHILRRSISGPGSLLGLMYSKYYRKENLEDRIVVTGQNLDSMYHIDTFAPNTEYMGVYRTLVTLKSSLLRLRYTSIHTYFMNLKSFLHGNSDIRYSVFEDTINSDFEHVKKNEEKTLDANYECTKENETLKLLKFLKIDRNNFLTHRSQNELHKKIKFFRFVQNTFSNYYSLRKAENIKRINPYSEAPILLALINYKLPLSSLFLIKSHSHSLFKKIHKIHHNRLIRKALKYKFNEDLFRVFKYFFNRLYKRDEQKEKDFSLYVNEIFEILTPSISMNKIKLSKNDEKYVDEILSHIGKSHIGEKLGDEIIRVLGTLVFLTHCYKSK